METPPLNSQQQYRDCQRQEGTATERATTTGPWTLDAHPSHYATMSTTSTTTASSGDRHATPPREVLPNGPVITLPLTAMFSSLSAEASHFPLSLTSQTQLADPPLLSYPPALFPPSLSLPQPLQNSVTQLQYLEAVGHPKFEDIMRAIFIGRQIGEDQEKQRLIADQHKRSMDSIHQARSELQKRQGSGKSDSELDMLLHHYLKLVQGLNQELVITQSEANNACTMFEQQIKAITNSASQMEGPVALSATDEDHLRQVLKRKYSDQIQHLSEEFRRKRKKGKLPVNATDVLRGWWEKNLAWPYPSEDEKRALAGETDLSATQINNWFINQRKRHWHKFFKDGRLPQSPEEAMEILRQQGILP